MPVGNRRRLLVLIPLLAVACAAPSRVPSLRRQGVFLPPQAVSAVDVSDDGASIAVSTMAFRQDRNFWLLSPDGKLQWGRHVAPWAPFQVAALPGAFGVGLAYSRVTSPHPTVSFFRDEKGEESATVDAAGELGFLRYGSGDWRSGWGASLIGDLLVRGPGYALSVPHHDGAWKLLAGGSREKFPLNNQRPFRMAARGELLALTHLVSAGFRKTPASILSVRKAVDGKELWNVKPLDDPILVPKPPQPEDEFPEMAEVFDTRPDEVLPFRIAVSVSIDEASSRIALTEYAGWMRIRTRPASGKWDPPYHVIPFLPRQRGTLRVFAADGKELARSPLPREGLFEAHADSRIWCSPLSWFARGAAGAAWRPADEEARDILRFDPARNAWERPLAFADAVADLALHRGKALVSCWDGWIHRLDPEGSRLGKVEAGAPCRLRWSADGSFAVAGTEGGDVLCLDPKGGLRWRTTLPAAEPEPLRSPVKPVFEELPVYQVGRVGPEHAYVGDTWLVKTERGGFLVDAGGTSSIPFTLQKIRAAGVEPSALGHLLHTHSHGDHAGAGYLWRTLGLKVVAPATAEIALGWLVPTLSDYGVWVPRPVDVALRLKRPGDELELEIAGVRVRAIFVPGHSMDSVIYAMELHGKRLVFTGDVGFVDANNSNILHRCWGDKAKAKRVIDVVRATVLPFRPDFVFTGHGAHRDGLRFVEELIRRSEEALER